MRSIIVLVAVGLVGCARVASSEATHAPADAVQAIAAIHTRKSGTCHATPEPRSRKRGALEVALGRHKNRVHLTPAQWAAMSDYLARPDESAARE